MANVVLIEFSIWISEFFSQNENFELSIDGLETAESASFLYSLLIIFFGLY